MDFNRTLVQCPKCGLFTPGPKCIYCGSDLHSSVNSQANAHQEESCSNHYGLNTRKKLNPRLCCYAWYRYLHRKELEYLRKTAEKDYFMATMGGNPIEHSDWYYAMQIYIDEYTDKVISRKKCYKYGIKDVDKAVRMGAVDKHKLGYCHAYWMVKKAFIKQEYGLIWHTPPEMDPEARYD